MKKQSSVLVNTAMLYVVSFAKLILPMMTMPYLTRVLSEEAYGFMSYVRSYMTYMQILIDFGFILSSVKDIVNAGEDKEKIGIIVGNTFAAKILLCGVSAVIMAVLCFGIDMLGDNWVYVLLSFIAVATSAFLADFLFRGIEKMHYITIIFLITKSISTVFTFILVKSDLSMMWIPVLEIAANVISALISVGIIKNLGIKIRFGGFFECFKMIGDSFGYFLSNVATTAFSALNTLIIGIYITDLTLVAYWSLCLNIISAVQGLYSPICNGVYPYMIKEKSLGFIHKVLLAVMPVVTVGCVFSFVIAKYALLLVGGEKYVVAAPLFRCMIPILFFSFPAQLYGWPALGALNKVRETTMSTVAAAAVQVAGLFILIFIGKLNLISMAILRCFTEACLMVLRMSLTYRYKKLYVKEERV